jgi:hypothetical protein
MGSDMRNYTYIGTGSDTQRKVMALGTIVDDNVYYLEYVCCNARQY